MKDFSLDHLSPGEFENFCHDLLQDLGFVNLDWRKGTGLPSSPSDSGRDIEGERRITDVDGTEYAEKWFVECKHHRKGVPASELQNAISWAEAERPHKLLIIASNFLSNPAKDYIESYRRNKQPPFMIGVWEKPKLEELTAGRASLLSNYDIHHPTDYSAQSKEDALTELKECIRRGDAVGLGELVDRHTANLISELSDARFPPFGGPPTAQDVDGRVAAYAASADILTALIAAGCNLSERYNNVWIRCIEKAADYHIVAGESELSQSLRRVPALILFYSGCLGAMTAVSEHYKTVKDLMFRPRIRAEGSGFSNPIVALTTWELLDKHRLSGLDPYHGMRLSLNKKLFEILVPHLDSFCALKDDYQRIFDRFEYLLGVVHVDTVRWTSSPPTTEDSPVGLFAFRQESDAHGCPIDYGPSFLLSMTNEAFAAYKDWPPLREGLFAGSFERFQDSLNIFESEVDADRAIRRHGARRRILVANLED